MLQPARTKYRKQQKGRNKGIATRGNKVAFGEYGLKAIGRGRLTARQIEAARRAMTRHIKRGGRIWIRIFPDKPVSQKPAEVRMGNGKGNPEFFVAEIRPGKVLYVPPRWAHRSVNTGAAADLITFFVYPGHAGHDYGSIEKQGFRKLVVARDDRPAIVDNPRWTPPEER